MLTFSRGKPRGIKPSKILITFRSDGFGMGLTVASELVSQYSGRMTLIKPGKLGGTTFRFYLPILTVRVKKLIF